MFVVAGLGLILNAAIMWSLRRDQRHDLNIRSAYLHMLGDALGSVGILVGAIVIRYTGWQRVDPLLSILIGALIIWTAWDVIKEVAEHPARRAAAGHAACSRSSPRCARWKACSTSTTCTSGAWARARTR